MIMYRVKYITLDRDVVSTDVMAEDRMQAEHFVLDMVQNTMSCLPVDENYNYEGPTLP